MHDLKKSSLFDWLRAGTGDDRRLKKRTHAAEADHSVHAMIGWASPSPEYIQRRASSSMRSIAFRGPQLPGAYSCGAFLDCAQPCSMGSMTDHAASASSPRMNKVWSPRMASKIRRS